MKTGLSLVGDLLKYPIGDVNFQQMSNGNLAHIVLGPGPTGVLAFACILLALLGHYINIYLYK